MMPFSKPLALLAIAGTLLVTPGAMRLDRDCRSLRIQHRHVLIDRHHHTCRTVVVREHRVWCAGYGIFGRVYWQVDKPKRLDRSWQRQLPDLRTYGLY